MTDAEVMIRLTLPEAVVLLGLLRRYSEDGRPTIEDQDEQRALWNLECVFEREDGPAWPSTEIAGDQPPGRAGVTEVRRRRKGDGLPKALDDASGETAGAHSRR